jgi:hypothetical protein
MIEYGRPKAEARGKYENIASRKGAKTRRKDEGRRKKRMEPQIDIDKHEYNVNHINLVFFKACISDKSLHSHYSPSLFKIICT